MPANYEARYAQDEYAYGEEPNEYLKAKLEGLRPGRILLPAEGEGRNAVYAATLGWEVHCFDLARSGMEKAKKLAAKHGVEIDYQVGTPESLSYPAGSFDVVALIYAHFDAQLKSKYNRLLGSYVAPGGRLIFEAFSKSHGNRGEGRPMAMGPEDEERRYSLEEVSADFEGFDTGELREEEVVLKEGRYHDGTGRVIRFLGVKKPD